MKLIILLIILYNNVYTLWQREIEVGDLDYLLFFLQTNQLISLLL